MKPTWKGQASQWLIACAAVLVASPALAIPYDLTFPQGQPRALRTSVTDALDTLLEDEAEGEAGAEAGLERLRVRTRKALTELMATEGFFSAQVVVDLVRSRGERPRFRVTVEPGLQTHVRHLALSVAGPLAQERLYEPRLQSWRDRWTLGPGAPFRQVVWEDAKNDAVESLRQHTFPRAQLAFSQAKIKPLTQSADLKVDVDSGPPFALGPLEVEGLKKYDKALVERYNPLVPGEPYDRERLLQLQSALQNTPYFSAVLVNVDVDAPNPLQAPVRVQVTEARSKRVGVGVGVSSNSGPHLELSYRQSPIWDKPYILQSGFRVDRLRTLLYADLLLPPGIDQSQDSVGVLTEQSDIQGLELRRAALGATRTRKRGNIDTLLAANLQRELRRLDGGETQQTSTITSRYTWTQRRVDNPVDPRKGRILTGQVGIGTALGDGGKPFTQVYARYQGFYPINVKTVGMFRGEIGHVSTPERKIVPSDFLFRAGGTQSVRGYAYQSLGVVESGAVLGGLRLATVSAETVHWFKPEHGGAVFYDAGLVADRFQGADWAHGAGIGYRFKTVAGPLAFDLAYGERDRRLRLHFSIAVAF